jgi:hypothetical protein
LRRARSSARVYCGVMWRFWKKPIDRRVAADVDKYGWHCLSVAPRVGDEGTPFTYTIGLFATYQHPELMVFGLGDKSYGVLSECVSLIKGGKRLPVNERIPDILTNDYDVFLRPILKNYFPEYLGTAERYYGRREFPAYVLFWPNTKNLFMWESDDPPSQAIELEIVEKLPAAHPVDAQ